MKYKLKIENWLANALGNEERKSREAKNKRKIEVMEEIRESKNMGMCPTLVTTSQ